MTEPSELLTKKKRIQNVRCIITIEQIIRWGVKFMNLLDVSRAQLIREVYESKKMIYRLISLPSETQGYVSTSLLPYLSMICDGIDSLFKEDNIALSSDFEDVNEISFTKLIGRTRASAKLLTDKEKINKAINILGKEITNFCHELKKDYSQEQIDFVNMFGQEDLGIFYYKNKPFANSSQLNLYIKPLNSNIMKVGDDIYKFSMQLGQYIGSFLSDFEGDILEELKREHYLRKVDSDDFKYADYIFSDEKHRNIFNDKNDKRLALYLFNMRCQLNFTLSILNEVLDNHPLKFRIQLLTYYYSVQALKYAFGSDVHTLDRKHQDMIGKVVEKHNEVFKNKTFRNNLFHYKILVEGSGKIDNNYFESMVKEETSVDLNELLIIVYKEMHKIEELIEEIIY